MECQICKSSQFKRVGSVDEYKIHQCVSCSLYQLNPLPSLEVRTQFYNGESNFNYYQSRLPRKFKRAKSKIKFLQKYINASDKTFLDIGCNIGAYVGAANDLGFKSYGIDLSEEAIKIAKKNFPKAHFFNQSADQFEEDTDVKYDIIVCRDIIEHVTCLDELMGPIKRLLKPKGILYITTPDAGHLRVPKAFDTWRHVHAPDHVFYFNKKNLVQLMENYNIHKKRIALSTRTTIDYIGQRI